MAAWMPDAVPTVIALAGAIEAAATIAEAAQPRLSGGERVRLLFAFACRCTDPAWENG